MQLRPMESADLELVLAWRNNPDVRKNMYTTHEISLDEHRAWWARVERDPTKRYFIAVDGDEPLGAVNFVDISAHNRSATWAFYSGVLGRKGLGSQMETLALDYAFDTLQLEKLSCEVLAFNTPVIRMHRKFGFRVEGIFRAHHVADGARVDVYRLAISRTDWLARLPTAPPATGVTGSVEATLATLPGAVCAHFGAARVVATALHADGDGACALRVVSRIGDRVIVEVEGPIRGDVELALQK